MVDTRRCDRCDLSVRIYKLVQDSVRSKMFPEYRLAHKIPRACAGRVHGPRPRAGPRNSKVFFYTIVSLR